MKANKPSKEKLEGHLRANTSIAVIAKKYDCSIASVHNWIKAYGLAGLQGKKKQDEEPVATRTMEELAVVVFGPDAELTEELVETVNDMVQESPTIAEVEQFHTDEPVQELPIVEMEQTGMTEEENMSDEEYDRIMAKVKFPAVPVVEMAEPEMKIFTCLDCGEKFFAEEYASLCNACYESLGDHEPISAEVESAGHPDHRETRGEIWEDIQSDLITLREMGIEQANKEFRDQLLQLVLAVTNGRGIA